MSPTFCHNLEHQIQEIFMDSSTSVLVIDHHSIIYCGFEKIFSENSHYDLKGQATNSEDGYEQFLRLEPDMVVIDLDIPGRGGLETIRRLKARENSVKILVYTSHKDTSHIKQALAAGATSYILKSCYISDIFNAVKATSMGNRYLCETTALKLAIEMIEGDASPLDKLSPREYEVFCYLMKGYKVSEIANLLSISVKTVATYQTQLKRKLSINGPYQMAKIAIQAGISF